ncbi:MAG: linear amide C-N hydrolase [Bacillota bacterium]|nr:linear amide C-N hydrolase [Bacillota bacterium]
MKRNDYRSEFTKIADYLYEVTFYDYDYAFEPTRKFFEKRFKLGGCSSVQNGMIRGRNYDWTYDEEPAFVIHVPATENRYASVGVARSAGMTPALIESGEDFEILRLTPYGTLDGMNDQGLTINMNVVNYKEKGDFRMKTEDTSDDIFPAMIPRLVLDYAANIEEALELIDQMDVYSMADENELHFMLTGKTSATNPTFKTIAIEFIPDENQVYKMHVIDKFVEDKEIMTNFHLTDFDGSEESLTEHPMGYERYQVLFENYEMGNTVAGMRELMKKVYYTRAYDLSDENFWYTEYSKGDLTMKNRGLKNLKGDVCNAGEYEDVIGDMVDKFLHRTRSDKAPSWQTVHLSVYDIEHLTLSVIPQEGDDHYDFKI